MKVLTYIEIDIPFCFNIYGQSPCEAAVGVTGDIKCFNTIATCQDRDAYIDDPVTLRFAEDVGFLPEDIDCIPSITSIAYTPAVVSLGEDLGTRASLQVTFKDHPWPDTGPGFDKYRLERPYNPFLQGTFWGKFRARQPFLRGRSLRWIRGSTDQALADMETRHFIIDSFSFNAAKGTYTLVAKDVLKFADDDRAQAPVISSGTIAGEIDATADQVEMSPVGIGNLEYDLSGHVAIGGKEIVAFKRQDPPGNDANTKLLLHMDGAHLGTSFIDSSSVPKTVTANGNVLTSTSDKKFGTAQANFDGTGDYLSLADHADWTPGGDFTIDFWAKTALLGATRFYFCHFTDANNRYFLSASSAGAATFSVISAGVTIVTMTSAAGVIPNNDGIYHHIAVVRNGNDWRIYVDGVSVANTTDADAIPNFTNQFRIGVDHAAANGMAGAIDEFRFSHVARWTANFTPPDMPYVTSSDILYMVRGQLGTEAQSHSIGDRVQNILRYDAEDAADIIYDLLVNYADVPESYITLLNWQTETDTYLDRVFSAIIAEPTGVKTLIAELIEDAALSIWWDDLEQQIRLRVLRAIPADAAIFNQGNYLTFQSREQPEKRVSQIWRYFAKRDPLAGQEDPDNYRSVVATVDLEAETDYGSRAIHKIFSRWIPFGGLAIAERANDLYLNRYRDPPRRFNFSTFRNELIVPELGTGYLIEGLGIQDETGAPAQTPIQITRLKPLDATFEIEAEEIIIGAPVDLTNRAITIDAHSLNINLRDLHDTLYPEVTDADVIAGVTLRCIITAGVIVGSSGTDVPAFEIGEWPAGFLITLVINGRVQGAGGRGSQGLSNMNGSPGGTALYTRHDIDLEVADGELWGGGGGGGAGRWRLSLTVAHAGSGGGGGAGQVPGEGGTGVTVTNPEETAFADPGQDGTPTAGGAGGTADSDGGDGGGPGLAGEDGEAGTSGSNGPGTGGAAGNAIDGVSFVNVTAGPGDRRGPEIN